MSVLLICHANTCRSVMAHVLLEKMLAARGTNGAVTVRSGGIANHARDGMIPSLDARIVLREEGIHLREDEITSTDLRRHRELIAEAHLIVTMTEQQKEMLAVYEEAHGRPIFTLKERDACIDCVMFQSDAARVKFQPKDGMELLVSGSVKVYAQRGR